MLEIHFQLSGMGCAEVLVATEEQRLALSVVDHTDALADLSGAVLRLADGSSRSEATLFEERRELVFTFERRGHDGVILEIVSAEAPRDLEPGVPERLVFRIAIGIRELIAAMAACLDRIARSQGIAGYEAMWPAHPFPREHRRRLLSGAGRRKQG